MQLSRFVKQHRAECVCFALFIILATIGFIFHEPSYDESQAWQIARTASWFNIISVIPIYEGHPPFWHLLLAGPAKLGISFQLTSSILGMVFLLVSGFLLFFKSPFPKWVRCCLPFSFFLFYQYGIIVRPYGLMMVLIFLLAYFFPQKDKRPGLFVGLLAALCACHLFGIAIAGGITLAWLWEMKGNQSWKFYLTHLRRDKRFQWMLGLLAWVLLIMSCICLPRMGAALQPAALPLSFARQAVYVLAAMPAEAVLTDLDGSFHTTRQILPWAGLISTAVIGLILWALTLLYTPRKQWLYLLLPYVCTGAVMLGYSSCHHIGVMLLIFIGYFWMVLAQPEFKWPGYPMPLNTLAKAMLLFSLLLPMAWTANTLFWDYKTVIYPGKEMADFLKKYNLTDQTIFVPWNVTPVPGTTNQFSVNTNTQPYGVMLNMYLDRNIFANFHNGGPQTYVDNFCPPVPEMLKIMASWREGRVPRVLINEVPLEFLYGEPKFMDNYILAYTRPDNQLWKLKPPKSTPQNIYLFHTLWDKYKDQILADAGLTPEDLPTSATPQTKNLQEGL